MIQNAQERVLAYIGLGSNLEQPERQILNALDRLEALVETRLLRYSSLYRSAAYGPVEQPEFVNAVAAIATRLAPLALLECLKGIEREQGRSPEGERWGPRIIDLDLLVFGDGTVDEPNLKVPHPGIAERNFVLLPLREIAPHLVIPGLGPVADLVIDDESWIERITEEPIV